MGSSHRLAFHLLAVLAAAAASSCGSGVRYKGDAATDDTSADTLADVPAETGDDPPADVPEDAPVEPPADVSGECGNGVPEEGEECDDGNHDNTDACTDECRDAFCGDGYVWAGHEECEGTGTEECTTGCGTAGTRTCEECEWTECCAEGETCGNDCDDDCDTVPDDGCSGVTNDTCSSPIDVSAGGRFTGNTSSAADDYAGASDCSGHGPDVVFSFTLTSASDVFISTWGSSFDTVFYVSATCGSADVACEDDVDTFGPGLFQEHVKLNVLPAGTYYIVLDGSHSTSHGDYRLDFYSSIGTAPGNRCSDPLPLDTNPETGTTSSMLDNFSSTCGGSSGSDHVYFRPVLSSTSATIETCNLFTDFDTLLAVREVCDDPGTELACSDTSSGCTITTPGAASITRTYAPGLYYVIVDSATPGGGWYDLDNTGF